MGTIVSSLSELTYDELVSLENLQDKGDDIFAACHDASKLREKGKTMKPFLTGMLVQITWLIFDSTEML